MAGDPSEAAQCVLESTPRRKRTTATRKSRPTSNPIGRSSRGRHVARGDDSGQASHSNNCSEGSRTRKKKDDETSQSTPAIHQFTNTG